MTSPSSQNSSEPPFYILVSHSLTAPFSAGPSTTLSHPVIEYHFADDSPKDLLPRTPGEQVVVLDYDVSHSAVPTAQSFSPALAVKGVKMYVIETSIAPTESVEVDEHQSASAILAEFRQRNAAIRSILDYPNAPAVQLNTENHVNEHQITGSPRPFPTSHL
ncbi:hypothetical protein BDW22DRAFT_109779 [Trametopsis cervina]|nr:hypothetical protein BDW22DRAFT_109779 [Trametopsis cervina]